VAEGADDLEGELLKAVRGAVGAEIPIFVTLDLHGNLTQTMVDHATALLGCHLYPHTDSYDRGVEAVDLAVRTVNGEIKPVTALASRPMMIPPSTTNLGPAKAINELCWEWEAGPGLIDVAFFHGFPHTDIPNMTVTVVAVADGELARAQDAAEAVAQRIWETRDEFLADLPATAEAIQQGLEAAERPVIIAEVSDNSGGGSPADGTHLLRALLEAQPSEAAFGFIFDPETAAQAHAAGVGATISVALGGKSDPELHGQPVEATAYVKCLTDGQFILQTAMGRGSRVDLGPMARLVIGGVDVIVGSVRTQTLDAELFLLHGIDVARYKIVALKSQQHFRAGFDAVAGKIIRTDPPGITTSNLANLPYERIQRPIWPLDREIEHR
jgi:microcystin degradation protein MlrC